MQRFLSSKVKEEKRSIDIADQEGGRGNSHEPKKPTLPTYGYVE